MEQHKLPKIQEMAQSDTGLDTFYSIFGHSNWHFLFSRGIQGRIPLNDTADNHIAPHSVL